MLKIELLRFQPQDIITTSVASMLPPHEINLPAGKCYCSVYGCSVSSVDGPHQTGYQDPIGKGYFMCNGINGSHTCNN